MRKVLIILIGLITTCYSFGQDKMIVDKPFNGYTHYGEYAKQIDSLTELPDGIQLNLHGYLKRILGTLIDSVSFSHGQIIDLDNKFKNDSVTYSNSWVVPKYDLNFILKDNSIGIHGYYLRIKLDNYGQILSSNWPKESHSDKNHFKSRADIEKFALKQAEIKGIDTIGYKVEFKYNETFDKLCWAFKFPAKFKKNRQVYYVFEIPWNYIELIDEYKTMSSIVN